MDERLAVVMQDELNGTLQDRIIGIVVDTKEVDAWNDLAWSVYRSKPEQAQALAEKALKRSKGAGDTSWIYKKGVAESQRTLAYLQARNGHFDESLALGLNALTLGDELGDERFKCTVLNVLAVNYKNLGDLSQALENYFLMEQVAEKIGDKSNLGLATLGAGTVHTMMKDYDQSRKYAERSLEIFQELGEKHWIAASLNNLANALYKLGNHEMVTDYYQRALTIFHELGDTRGEIFSLCSLAEVYMETGKMTLAMARLDQALTKTKEVKDPGQTAKTLLLTGKAHILNNQPQQAVEVFQQTADHAGAYKLWQYLYESHLLLSEAYKAMDDYRQALTHRERYDAVKETAFAEEKARQIQNLEVLHHTREMQKEAVQLARLLKETERLASTDALTQIFNRRYFEDTARQEIARARRYRHALSLIIFDVDDFKKVNDNYGHSIGDQALTKIAEIARQNLRQVDTLARYEEGRFAILLPETHSEGALIVAERVRKLVETAALKTNKENFRVTVSLGVMSLAEEDQGLDDLIKRAADALYRAKEAGKNRRAIGRHENK